MMKFIVLLLLTAFVNSGLAFDCYLCSTVDDPNCGKDFVSKDVKIQGCVLEQHDNLLQRHPKSMNTTQVAPFCVKFQGADTAGITHTVRACSLFGAKTCDIIKERAKEEGSYILGCEICNTPLCNSSYSTAVFPIFIVSLLVALKML